MSKITVTTLFDIGDEAYHFQGSEIVKCEVIQVSVIHTISFTSKGKNRKPKSDTNVSYLVSGVDWYLMDATLFSTPEACAADRVNEYYKDRDKKKT